MKKILLIVILVCTKQVNAQLCFNSTTNFAANTNPFSVASADLNGDGKKDLAVANWTSNDVSILLGTGTGSFGTVTNFTVGTWPVSVISADFNGDGKADLAVGNYGSNDVSILLGNGTGNFGTATSFTAGTNPWSITNNDFNGDGKTDLAVANNIVAGTTSVLLGTGTGSFGSATQFAVGNGPLSVTSADFNGDAKADLAVANGGSHNVSILLGTGAGTFGTATNFLVDSLPWSVISADFNGDSKLDLAVANLDANNISILLGTGTGSFASSVNFSVWYPVTVISADFNGDGVLDLAAANNGSTGPSGISVLLGTGTGSFGGASNFTANNSPHSIISGDFNGDSKVDLAIANYNSNDVSVLLNCTVAGIVYFNNEQKQVNIYPNPSSNNITIQSSTELGAITIYNCLGEKVYQSAIHPSAYGICPQGEKVITIDIDHLAAGVYTVQAQDRFMKLVKE